MATPERYAQIEAEFAEHGCKLLTSLEGFVSLAKDKPLQHSRLSFIGKCGHESSAVYTNFHTRRTGQYCKTCVKDNKKSCADVEMYSKNEYETIKFISNLLSSDYDLIQTDEGCSADMLVRRKPATEDKWLRIQVKTTKGRCHNMYSFHGLTCKYKDMVIVCHSLSDNKVWMFPYNDVIMPSKLNISDASKYNDWLCSINDFSTKLYEYSWKCIHVSEEEGNHQNNEYQRRESVYAKKRINTLTFLDYEKSKVQNTVTDFKVNGKKVQEKVIGAKKGKSYLFQLARNNGKDERRRKYRNYRLGENDIYWFHSSFDELFWIVPEMELFNHGLLAKADETKPPKHFGVNPKTYKTHDWLKKYEFNYETITEDMIVKIKGLFSIL